MRNEDNEKGWGMRNVGWWIWKERMRNEKCRIRNEDNQRKGWGMKIMKGKDVMIRSLSAPEPEPINLVRSTWWPEIPGILHLSFQHSSTRFLHISTGEF